MNRAEVPEETFQAGRFLRDMAGLGGSQEERRGFNYSVRRSGCSLKTVHFMWYLPMAQRVGYSTHWFEDAKLCSVTRRSPKPTSSPIAKATHAK